MLWNQRRCVSGIGSRAGLQGIMAEEEEALVFTIVGYSGCSFHGKAKAAGQALVQHHPEVTVDAQTLSRGAYMAHLEEVCAQRGISHRTSPIVFKGTEADGMLVGGCDDFLAILKSDYPDVEVKSGCVVM